MYAIKWYDEIQPDRFDTYDDAADVLRALVSEINPDFEFYVAGELVNRWRVVTIQ